MIDEKKILYFIKTQINPYGKPFTGTIFEFGLKLMNYIENMEKVGEWIPCSERIPEDDRLVLAAEKDTNDMYIAWFDHDKENEQNEGWYTYYGFPFAASAWMELPEPYKAGVE